ncbi:MAG: peptide chain release factor N(5)-glutamine methyltransferase [Candidatus Binatus sp.]|uniref:peptide chain release factor N(5)-glutamine methyltransferase n=2 Tax=Candidatus Binatus sp. TaxID=2811406 RepID=UPI003C70B8D4
MSDAARRALEQIDTASRRLATAGIESSRLDAELLLAASAGVTREAVVIGSIDLSLAILKRFDALIARREKREPIAYIVGHKEFYSLDFEVTPAVLIPRPETEFVVTAALESIAGKADARVLDIGTGSGAIAIAIAVNAPRAHLTALDISADALAVASRNALRHQVQDRMTLRRADCFDVLDGGEPLGTFEVVLSNPPYLDDAEIAGLEPDVRGYEPRIAMNAGVGGMEIHRRIIAGAFAHLAVGGELVLEVAMGQAEVVTKLIGETGLRVVAVINDFAGHPRVVRARRVAG